MSSIASGTTTTTGLVYTSDTTGNLVLQTNGTTTAVTIDTSQNVGVGVTTETWSLGKAIEVGSNGNSLWGAGSGNVLLGSNFYYNSGYKYAASSVNASYYQQYQGSHFWNVATSGTAGSTITFTQAMTLSNTGILNVTGTSSGSVQCDTVTSGGNSEFQLRRANVARWFFWNEASTNRLNITPASFASGVSLTDTGTSWAAYSDRRIKSNIVDLDLGLSTVLAIKPRRYTFTANSTEDIGFIAQELKEALPEAVVGQEIEFDEADTDREKSAKLLSVTRDTLIPVLVKAIQELSAKVTALEAKVGA